MDRTLIEKKLESLRRCLLRIREKCPATPERLSQDADAQDIVALNLTRAVQLSVDIGAHLIADTDGLAPETMGQTFDSLASQGLITQALATRMKNRSGSGTSPCITTKPSTGPSSTPSCIGTWGISMFMRMRSVDTWTEVPDGLGPRLTE